MLRKCVMKIRYKICHKNVLNEIAVIFIRCFFKILRFSVSARFQNMLSMSKYWTWRIVYTYLRYYLRFYVNIYGHLKFNYSKVFNNKKSRLWYIWGFLILNSFFLKYLLNCICFFWTRMLFTNIVWCNQYHTLDHRPEL